MAPRLRYAKVIDRELFVLQGGRIHPGLHNEVVYDEEFGHVGAFLVLRAWGGDNGTFTEQWRIEAPGGVIIYESIPREMYLATPEHVERLEDELADLELEPTTEGYTVVFLLDELVVARVAFTVKMRAKRP